MAGRLAGAPVHRPAARPARRHFERLWPAVGDADQPSAVPATGPAGPRRRAATRQAAAAWYKRAAAYPNSFYGQLAAERARARAGRRSGRRCSAAAPPPPARPCGGVRRRTLADAVLPRSASRATRSRSFAISATRPPPTRTQLAAVVELAASCGRADLVLAVTRAAAGNGTYLVREAFPLPRVAGVPGRTATACRAGAGAGRGAPGEPVRPGRAQPRRCPGPDAADAGDRAGDVARAGRALLAGPADRATRTTMSGWAPAISARQLERFDNEPALALAAYNAGPRPRRRLARANGDPRGGDRYRLVDWIELIPFAETRNYVQRVLEARGMYRVVLAPPPSQADGSPPTRPRRSGRDQARHVSMAAPAGRSLRLRRLRDRCSMSASPVATAGCSAGRRGPTSCRRYGAARLEYHGCASGRHAAAGRLSRHCRQHALDHGAGRSPRPSRGPHPGAAAATRPCAPSPMHRVQVRGARG